MDDEARVLLDMFPNLPEQALLSILRNSQGDFSAAVDEALTIASLGNPCDAANIPMEEVPQEQWEDASPLLQLVAASESGTDGPPSLRKLRSADDDDWLPSNTPTVSPPLYADTAPAVDNRPSEQQKLPWETKTRYMIGSGELGLLSELQMPRRGSTVALPPEFLRLPIPTGYAREGRDSPPPGAVSSQLIDLHDDDHWEPSVGTTRTQKFRTEICAGVAANPRGDGTGSVTRARQAQPVSKDVRGEDIRKVDGLFEARDHPGSIAAADARPNASGSSGRGVTGGIIAASTGMFLGAPITPVRDVETASAAVRIAAFRPGTRFRVAVDKGSTGLGITVKEIRGRFFVYRLQALPDGSPGAAEEAGVKAGDELLGVEELDFESERWDMDQLVSYMGELVGVVILHIMRGYGPLPRAPKTEEKNMMSHGVARTNDDGSTADDVGLEGGGGGRSGTGKVEGGARRLVEVLEEEELSKSSEAADVSRLYCQINDRARQWDTGELWLSVVELARRPATEVITALANQWQPGKPVGWVESDSSDRGDESVLSSNGRFQSCDVDENDRMNSEIMFAATKRDFDEEDDPAVDLDKIGTALLGKPLFADPLSATAVGRGTSSLQANDETTGRYWSPWPQLVALESKTARRDTVVPTQGLRKALNVRVLGEVASPEKVATSNGRSSSGGRLQSTPYLLWVMDVESGAEWKVRRCHAEFAELREVCTGMRPSLARFDFPAWLPDVKETPGMVEARRPRLEAYLQRLCSLLYMGPLHPSSAHVAHVLQDFLGTSPRVETLKRLQRRRPERELRQALQVRAWQILRLPPLERAVVDFVREILEGAVAPSKKAMSAETALKKVTEITERLQYVVTEGCFEEFREMVRASEAQSAEAGGQSGDAGVVARVVADTGDAVGSETDRSRSDGQRKEEGKGDRPEWDSLAEEDEALELISGSVRRQVEAEVFVPVMGRLFKLLRTEGPTSRLEKAVALGVERARRKPQSFHGIPLRTISPSSWSSVSKLLRTMGSFTLPCDKLDALVAVAHAIPALYKAEHPSDDADNLGADDFLPIFIFVLVNSKVEAVAAQSVVLETLCDSKKMMGEAGFCVATLSAALQHLGRNPEDRSPRKGTMSTLLGRRS